MIAGLSGVYQLSIFGNHVTAGVLWVKMTFLPACKQIKWRPDRTKFGGEIVSQTRVPPVSTPMNNLFSTLKIYIHYIYSDYFASVNSFIE